MHRRDLKVGDRVEVVTPYSEPREAIVWMIHSDDRGIWVRYDATGNVFHVMARDVKRKLEVA